MKKVVSIILSLLIILSAFNLMTFSVSATESTMEPVTADIILSDKEVKASPITEDAETFSPAEESDHPTTLDVPKIAALKSNKIDSEPIGENARFVHYAKNWKYIYEKNDTDRTATIVDVEINLPAASDDLPGSGSSMIPIESHPLLDLLTFPSVIEGYTVTKIAGASSAKGYVDAVVIPGTVKTIGDSAFSHFEYIHTVELSAGVTTIGGYAFRYCASLKNINFPEGLTYIGYAAFNCCNSLEEITLPKSLTTLSYTAFNSCLGLKKVNYNPTNIPNAGYASLDGGQYGPFNGCSALETVVIGDDVEVIGSCLFLHCTGLKNINIPDSVKAIKDFAFYNTKSLNTITIPPACTEIGSNAFGKSGLITLNLNADLNNEYAFSGLEGLTTVVVGDGVTNIKNSTFYNCPALTDVTLPDTMKSIGGYAFRYCASLKNINFPEGLTYISSFAFSCCNSLEEITLPKSLTTLSYTAFNSCLGLKKVNYNPTNIPNAGYASLDGGQYGPFNGCSALETVVIGDDVEVIGSCLFLHCTGLKNINIPDSVKAIKDFAFYNTKSLNTITIPPACTEIGSNAFGKSGLITLNLNADLNNEYAFSGLEGLTTVVVGDGVTNIKNSTFYNCPALTDVTLPDTMKSIGGYAFCYCSSLKNINFPEGLTYISSFAFSCCNSLEEITLPKSLTTLSYTAFNSCLGLKKVNYNPTNIPNAGYASLDGGQYGPFNGCSALETVVIGDDVEVIGSCLFLHCIGLKNINIPDSVKAIKDFAFYNTKSLTNITIPRSVTSFGNYVFLNDDDLTVYGYKDSAAQSYCKSNSIRFIALDSLNSGDANGDNVVDILDATVIQKFTVDKASLTDEQKNAADVNADGVVDILDATDIQKFTVDKITEFKKKA